MHVRRREREKITDRERIREHSDVGRDQGKSLRRRGASLSLPLFSLTLLLALSLDARG